MSNAILPLFVQMMSQMWPYIGEYVEGILRTTVQQSIQGSLSNKFQNFSFETIDLGDVVCSACAKCFLLKVNEFDLPSIYSELLTALRPVLQYIVH